MQFKAKIPILLGKVGALEGPIIENWVHEKGVKPIFIIKKKISLKNGKWMILAKLRNKY